MGAEQSSPDAIKSIEQKIYIEFNDFINGNIDKESLRYIFLLMNASNFFKYDNFYLKANAQQIADYISDLGILDIKESKIIIRQIIQNSSNAENATKNLQVILPKMRVKFNEIYISPSVSKKLFNQIFSYSYKTKWGKYSPKTIYDWKSPDIIQNYNQQSQCTFQNYIQHLPKFNYNGVDVNQKSTKIVTFSAFHSEDISTVILMNSADQLIKRKIENIQGILPFEKKVSKPFHWENNIHKAAQSGDESSVKYCLHLLPILLNCPDIKGNTPSHMAALGNCPNIIKLLASLGANFDIKNDKGFLPHHLSGGKEVVLAFNLIGVDLNEPSSSGNTLLEIKTKNFDMSIIETLLKLKIDIFKPNSRGTYWMQYAIHYEYYKKSMTYVKFQKKVRKIIRKNFTEYFKNPEIKELLNRKAKKCEKEDIVDINNSFSENDNDRIIILLALGAKADLCRKDKKTNLMLCAERNDSKMAEILLNNYCNPNFKNEKGENLFWIASSLQNFETALTLRNHGAKMDELSNSGNTILHISYKDRNMKLFNFLLRAGASPNTKNKESRSVLFQAFYSKDDKIAELLQDKYNGNINTQEKDNNSLAHLALLEQDLERLNYYIQRKINLEIKNNNGYTIFMISIIMFDDLQSCSSLLSRGCNINTIDSNGNTALLNILHSKEFNRCKFDFLINNNCNINIKNNNGEYPISACIAHELNDEANILIDKSAIINDSSSVYEPIVVALKMNNQFWFEKLLKLGATASNYKYSVLENYINSSFFNFELMKTIKSVDSSVGAPIQAALRKKYNDVVDYIWGISDEKKRVLISRSVDLDGMIPISVAIVLDYKPLVNELLWSKSYEVMKPDKYNKTPFIYACQKNQINWMKTIFSRINIKNANIVDKSGKSALTYVAENNDIQFCNFLFLNNIEVFDISCDSNEIISSYRELLNKFEELKKSAEGNYDLAKEEYDKCDHEVWYIGTEISSLKSEISSLSMYSDSDPYGMEISSKKSSLSSAEHRLYWAKDKLEKAEKVMKKYEERFDEIKKMTRKDLLTNFKYVVKLAKDDDDIYFPNNRFSTRFFDPETFIKSHSIMRIGSY